MTEEQIWDLAALIAKDWYRQAVRQPFAQFFLWYRRAKQGERYSLPIVATEKVNEEYCQSISISNAWTKEITTRKIAEELRHLPILGTP
jgi:hypothetical protein